MKWLFLLVSFICAALLSMIAVLHSLGRLSFSPPDLPEESAPAVVTERMLTSTVFPEQRRGVDELMVALNAEQERLQQREAALRERETVVNQESVIVKQLRDELTNAQAELEARLVQVEAQERANLRKIAEVCSKMDAQNASRLLFEMDEQRAAAILMQLGDRQAGAIMDAVVTLGDKGIERAVVWSDVIRRMRDDRNGATQ